MQSSKRYIPAPLRQIVVLMLLLVLASVAVAQREHVLYAFQGGADGEAPFAGLIADASGNLYGTTSSGGGGSFCGGAPCGTVFEVSPPVAPGGNWTETILYAFQGFEQADGSNPYTPLVFDQVGNIYGSTALGGGSGPNCSFGCGTVFELNLEGNSWNETVLYAFKSGIDGLEPMSNLVFDSSGNLYGTTKFGGGTGCGGPGCGTVFELSPPTEGAAWTEQVIYAFQGGRDGSAPIGNLVIDTKGNLYGSTQGGGKCSTCGTVFTLVPPTTVGGTWTERIPHYFDDSVSDGMSPAAGPAYHQGSLYGTTQLGGQFGLGTTYAVTLSSGGRDESLLYSFGADASDTEPVTSVLSDSAGNLYGTTSGGGLSGTVFKLQPPTQSGGNWTENVLHTFTGGSDGVQPWGLLMRKGTLYGTTRAGGSSSCGNSVGCGVVFAISNP